ncbi:HIT domain-containing protein [Actinoplanes sp. CA-142083]|uniref:HIT domain-containing protein n=1 Tax=Actinoplanes sp. CA-142083 TaxID=3239903 RepID=UPI003D91570D
MDNNCLFCRIVAGEIPATVVHETETTLAFRDIDPKAAVHVLVIPKEHHADVVALARNDPAGSADLLAAASAVAEAEGLLTDGFRLMFNTGTYAGQEVFHVHAHVLGGEPLGPMLAPKGPGFSAPSGGPGAGSGGAMR